MLPPPVATTLDEQARHVFSLFDRDDDGVIEGREEVATLLRALNRAPTPGTLSRALDAFPSVTMENIGQLLNAVPAVDMQAAIAELKSAFATLDPLGAGSIPANELRRLLTTVGPDRLSAKECDDLLRIADPMSSGLVHYDTLIPKLINSSL